MILVLCGRWSYGDLEIAGVLAGGRFAVEAVGSEGPRVEGEIAVAITANVPLVGFSIVGEGWLSCEFEEFGVVMGVMALDFAVVGKG